MSISKATLVVFWLLCVGTSVEAQHCHFALHGYIREASNNEVLPYASIFVKEANRGAMTDASGYFSIADLCENTSYTVEVSHVECAHFTQIVRVTENTTVDFKLEHNNALNEVVIMEKAVALAPTQAQSNVGYADLEASKGINLGETLKRLPGVTTLNAGATISKPVIQGLHSNRIAIVTNNVVLEGQQWGSEHAPEVDPFTADKVSVVKGAAGVRYGVGAMGGAILIEPAPLREKEGIGGWLSLGGFSNGRGGVSSGAADWHLPGRSLTFRLQGTAKHSGNLRAPDYYLGNTGVSELNFSAMAGWKTARWQHEIGLTRFDQKLGILRAAHISDTTTFGLAIRSDVPLNNVDAFSWKINRPYQLIQHNMLKYKAVFHVSDKWKFTQQYSWQYNYRREFDGHPPKSDPLDLLKKNQLSFRIWTNTLDLALEHLPIHHWQGGVGVQGTHQLNYVGQGGLIPDYLTLGAAVWAMERWRRYPIPWEFEIGARYDYRWSHVTSLGNGSRNIDDVLSFGNASGTLGGIYRVNNAMKISLNSGLAWRPPHVNELYAEGVHHGSATYERGRSDLVPEQAWNTNLTWQWQPRRTEFTLTLYRNQIQNFMYLKPQQQGIQTIRGTFPLYTFEQSNAVLQGFDGNMSVPVSKHWSVEGRVSLLRGFRASNGSETANDTNKWLPLMPSDRFQYGLKWTLGPKKDAEASRSETFIRLLAMTVLRQSRFPEGLFKAPPPTFSTLSLDAGHSFPLGGKSGKSIEVGLTMQNMTNVRYREYLNFFRYYADEPGVNVGLRGKLVF